MKNISFHILDITENSFHAASTKILLQVEESIKKDIYKVIIEDNGKGMSKEMLNKVTDPYFTSRETRKVGLGIPLIYQNTQQSGGSFNIVSKPGQGSCITAIFGLKHFNRPPVGDLADTITHIFACYTYIQVIYKHITDLGDFKLDSTELRKTLGDMPLSLPQVKALVKEMIENNLIDLGAEFNKEKSPE